MTGSLTAAQRTGEVVVCKGNVGAVLRMERHLKEVEQIAVGAAKGSSGRDCPRVNDVIARSELRKSGACSMVVDALGHIDIPPHPAAICAIGAGSLHDRSVIGITREVAAEPGNHHVSISVRRHPGGNTFDFPTVVPWFTTMGFVLQVVPRSFEEEKKILELSDHTA